MIWMSLKHYLKNTKGSRPMNMTKEHIETGVPRWRIHIFEKDAAPVGDKEILFVEDKDHNMCILKAIEGLKRRMSIE